MRTKIIIPVFIISILSFWSCNDYLDKMPDEDATLKDVFSKSNTADQFLANTYFHLPNEMKMMDRGTAHRNPFVGGCDEMEVTYAGSPSHFLNSGAYNPSIMEEPDLPAGEKKLPIWSECYMGIRKANIFIDNIDNVPLNEKLGVGRFTEEMRNARKGEAYFLRAFFYFQLIRCFGPVPLTDGTLPTDVDYRVIERKPIDQCVQYIVDDCNRAIALIKNINYNLDDSEEMKYIGRVTKAAPMALKSRVLLYMASPLWNGNPDYADFRNKDGEKLFPAEDKSRWNTAAEAAMDCITALEGTYGLYQGKGNAVEDYQYTFIDLYNKEWIFWRNIKNDHHTDFCADPISLRGASILSPTQEMVDAYQMADGSTPITGYTNNGLTPIINSASGYTETNYAAADPQGRWPEGIRSMYANREPRFYASINFAGQKWKSTTCDFWFNGKDGRKDAQGTDYTSTGYLMRKLADPGFDVPNWSGGRMRCWLFFRYAEIYLNYAEAINEAEGPAKAYEYVNRVRTRAGLPNLPAGLDYKGMQERIKHERRIEFAFETHRFFDVRRWKTAEYTENQPIHGMKIALGAHLQDDAFYERTEVEERVFDKNKHYLFPIPQVEINRTERILIQNPGWTTNE